MNIEFTPESELGKILKDWWLSLKDDSGARAELRRCNSILEVVMTPTYQRLYSSKLRFFVEQAKVSRDQMAAVVGLLAHLKHDAEATVLSGKGPYVELLAEQMAYLVSADRPLVSELRFRRLLQNEREELYPALIRIIRMMKGSATLYGLTHSVFYWGDKVKKRWAYAYFPHVPKKKSA